MRLSDIKGEKALDVVADLIEPVAEIMSDKRIPPLLQSGKAADRIKAIKIGIKEHKRSVISMMAILHDEDPETYQPSVLTIPVQLLELLNDPEVQALFGSQAQTSDGITSGPASENIEEA